MTIKLRKNLIEVAQDKQELANSVKLFCITFALILIVLFSLRYYVFNSVLVSGKSMNKTLNSGDLVLVNKLDSPNRGEIVVFYATYKDKNGNIQYLTDGNKQKYFYIKRIIAFEGETVYWVDGKVSVKTKDGQIIQLDETYVYGETYSEGFFGDNEKGILIEEGKCFVLGDNRLISNDSRGTIGQVDVNLILGVVPQWVVDYKDSIFRFLFKLF